MNVSGRLEDYARRQTKKPPLAAMRCGRRRAVVHQK